MTSYSGSEREYDVKLMPHLSAKTDGADSHSRVAIEPSLEYVEKRIYDNDYVTRPIPQNDYQYAWISASLAPSGANSTYSNLGHGYHIVGFNQPTPSGSRPIEPIMFASASHAGSALGTTATHGTSADRGFRYFGIAEGSGEQHIPNVHRLNLNIRESQNTWLTDNSGAVALGFFASGGILPADEPLPIGHNTNEHKGGFAYASRLGNLHNYVNSAIQYSTGLRVVHPGSNGDAIRGNPTDPSEDMLMLQGSFIEPGINSLVRNEPIRFDLLPIYWSSSFSGHYSSGSHENVDYTDSSTDHQHYAINQSVAGIFNSLMWKRNGPYGYPTWKQIRGDEHILTQTMRKNNRYVIVDPQTDRVVYPAQGTEGRVSPMKRMVGTDAVAAYRALGHIKTAERKHNHYHVPVLDRSSTTLLFALHQGPFRAKSEIGGGRFDITYEVKPDSMLYANVTHVNNLKYFPNSKLNEDLGLRDYKKDRTAYNDLREMYTEMIATDGLDAYALADLTYRETIFPKSENVGRPGIRQRAQYDVGYWASDPDKEYKAPDNDTMRQPYHEPVGRRTYFEHPDPTKPYGVWEFSRGSNAAPRTLVHNGTAFMVEDAFNNAGVASSINEEYKARNRTYMSVSASIWPMDGSKTIASLTGHPGTIGSAQYRASASNEISAMAEPFTMADFGVAVKTHGAPGILQNQFTWFHNGMSIGFEPTTISSSNAGDYNAAGTRNAVASSSVMGNVAYTLLSHRVGTYLSDRLTSLFIIDAR